MRGIAESKRQIVALARSLIEFDGRGVAFVILLMIGAGLIERPEPGQFVGEVVGTKLYRPGTAARGGYVLDENGKTVQRHVWEKEQRRKKREGR